MKTCPFEFKIFWNKYESFLNDLEPFVIQNKEWIQ